MLDDHGREVLVANARKVRLIYREEYKTDRIGAEKLARLARLDPELLSPIKLRGETSQLQLALLHTLEALVGMRTKHVNHVRGLVKAFRARLPKSTAQNFHHKVAEHLLGNSRRSWDWSWKPSLVERAHPGVRSQAGGGGRCVVHRDEAAAPDPRDGSADGLGVRPRLRRSVPFRERLAGRTYLGFVPATDQSGTRDPQKRIFKHGNELMRKLLVNCAHYALGPFGEDSDLRRHGEKIAGRDEKEHQETRGGGEKALGAVTPPMGYGRGLRTAVQREPSRMPGNLRAPRSTEG